MRKFKEGWFLQCAYTNGANSPSHMEEYDLHVASPVARREARQKGEKKLARLREQTQWAIVEAVVIWKDANLT